MNILIILPARGGSKGIPRKNLRPLNGKPLIAYAIGTALKSTFDADVYVSTDDEEIAFIAEKYLAKVHKRDPSLAKDATTLDPVIYQAYKEISEIERKSYDLIVTMQPTSPLLSVGSLDQAISLMLEKPEVETVIAAVNDTHLTWSYSPTGQYVPNYEARVNRQQLPQVFKETGSFFISRAHIVTPNSRIGSMVELFQLPSHEAIDIDTFQDWSVCEYLLKRKTILFSVSGYPEIGLGHVYNCLILASEILDHDIIFLVDRKSKLAYDKIKSYNYRVLIQQSEYLMDDIIKLKPDFIINDRLDTTTEYITILKAEGITNINFEDLGPGANKADLVINAIYPEQDSPANHYFGSTYFCAREEFFLHEEKVINPIVKNVLISFGGTDPNNFTEKVLEIIYPICKLKGIQIHVVLGLGYMHDLRTEVFEEVSFHDNVNSISEFMYNADVAFSSAGRTVYELALMGTPSIILAQNERELTHFFASEDNGFINLGLGNNVSEDQIFGEFMALIDNLHLRQLMQQKMLKNEIKKGKQNVLNLIREVIKIKS
ncbi:MAG: CMP-N-acetylneuraminic acid synthetase [Marivirga sp.]|jgi:CMP-N-acetylneuraminic acid synthetase/spore coat polysaccharide biosynthesis predicted glycosyltransferase SpsG